MIVDLTKGPCQADVIYRNFDSAGAAALFNLALFPGIGMLTFAYSERVPPPEGRMVWLDFPRHGLVGPDGRLAKDFFSASIESGDLAVATVKLSDPLDNPFVRSFRHPLWTLWLRSFVPRAPRPRHLLQRAGRRGAGALAARPHSRAAPTFVHPISVAIRRARADRVDGPYLTWYRCHIPFINASNFNA